MDYYYQPKPRLYRKLIEYDLGLLLVEEKTAAYPFLRLNWLLLFAANHTEQQLLSAPFFPETVVSILRLDACCCSPRKKLRPNNNFSYSCILPEIVVLFFSLPLVVVKKEKDVCSLIEAGFEFVCAQENLKFFRKRK